MFVELPAPGFSTLGESFELFLMAWNKSK